MRGSVRRGIAVVAAAAATLTVYMLAFGDEGGGRDRNRGDGAEEVPGRVRDLVAKLSVEQKVDAVLLLGFEGTDATAPFLEEVRSRQLGAILLRPENWTSLSQATALVDGLEAAAREAGGAPPLIAAAQEGGDYRAFPELPPEERQLDVGDLGSPERVQEWARETGTALAEVGIDMNLSPIADVATLDSPVADRAFSDDPAIVAQMTAAAARGCAEAGIACVGRHFPGLGAASQSTDRGPATVGLDLRSLQSRDLAPFEAAVEAELPALMLSHAFYSAYDPVTPASLSPVIAGRLLRTELGFRGVAITDDLGAGAIRATVGARAAAVDALQAGADMLLVESPQGQGGVRRALLAALESGELDRARLDQAAGRVLELKRRLGLLEPR